MRESPQKCNQLPCVHKLFVIASFDPKFLQCRREPKNDKNPA